MKIEQSVIDEMVSEYWSLSPSQKPSSYPSAVERMQAAAEVLADKVLGPMTQREWDEFCVAPSGLREGIDAFITSRHALIRPKPTLRDKVLALLQTNTVTTDALATQIISLVEAHNAESE